MRLLDIKRGRFGMGGGVCLRVTQNQFVVAPPPPQPATSEPAASVCDSEAIGGGTAGEAEAISISFDDYGQSQGHEHEDDGGRTGPN